MTNVKLASIGLALILSAVAVSSAEARQRQQSIGASQVYDRHNPQGFAAYGGHETVKFDRATRKRGRTYDAPSYTRKTRLARSIGRQHGERFVEHPAGCPSRAFCGCGVAMKVFGKPIRELWLASNWFKFPHASPAPGMVAVRNHHVFYIEAVLGKGMVMAYDPNSGGHRTRVHPRSLAGYSVRNPNGTVAMR